MNRLICLVLCTVAYAGWGATTPQKYGKTLTQPADIQGYPCAKGYAWFYPDGHLASYAVAREIDFWRGPGFCDVVDYP